MPSAIHTRRRWEVRHADCLQALPKLPPDSIDAIVTDPPYGLTFMGARWDRIGGEGRRMQEWHEAWAREALRVLAPGGHLLAFGGTRTFHRLTSALEDAGFEIRDCLCWLYGSGFPKSVNLALAIDKAAGHPARGRAIPVASTHLPTGRYATAKLTANPVGPYHPSSDAAAAWQGWGTALKPAWEPIVLARKPIGGTVAQNVIRHRTGALNIDGCRIAFQSDTDERETKTKNRHADFDSGARKNRVYGRDKRTRGCRGDYDASGRWPANLLLSHTIDCRRTGHRRVQSNSHHPRTGGAGGLGTTGHRGQRRLAERSSPAELVERWECSPACPVRLLDQQSGISRSTGGTANISKGKRVYGGSRGLGQYLHADAVRGDPGYGDIGGASRFFYCAKANRAERDAGLGGFDKTTTSDGRNTPVNNPYQRGETQRQNVHPTVKPIALMRYLVRLVTPPGGTVLDPFAGSGTTGAAAVMEGARFLGIEQEVDYVLIARARIKHWAKPAARRTS